MATASIDGLYTAIGSIINDYENANYLALDVENIINDVKKEVNVYSASLDWYIRFALRAAVEIGLYQKGYRSVKHGEGIFVNPENCKKPEYLARLYNNAKLNEIQKKTVVEYLTNTIKNTCTDGQLTIDFNTGTIMESITESQLLEMLKEDARKAQ